mgnify:CR=1 FL=1
MKNSSMPVYDIQKFYAAGGEDFVVFNGPDEQFVSGRVIAPGVPARLRRSGRRTLRRWSPPAGEHPAAIVQPVPFFIVLQPAGSGLAVSWRRRPFLAFFSSIFFAPFLFTLRLVSLSVNMAIGRFVYASILLCVSQVDVRAKMVYQ